jgi:putative ABC transport system substrate-binding protein
MRRREFIPLVMGATIAWPAGTPAQQQVPTIGYLNPGSLESDAIRLIGFRQGLREMGYVEGQNVAIECRWAAGLNDRLPALAADLVNRQVTLIVAAATPAALAAKAATSVIPIVFSLGTDPVESGLVASLNRPVGNATGVVILSADLTAKRLDLVHELLPTAVRIALLINPTNAANDPQARSAQDGAQSLGLQLVVLRAGPPSEIDAALESLVQSRASALVVAGDPLFTNHRAQIVALAGRHAVPATREWREFVAAGGLMSYGTDLGDINRQAGVLTGKILKGAKPADLPVEQAVKVRLAINLNTAQTLGLTIPSPLLARADEVIE